MPAGLLAARNSVVAVLADLELPAASALTAVGVAPAERLALNSAAALKPLDAAAPAFADLAGHLHSSAFQLGVQFVVR